MQFRPTGSSSGSGSVGSFKPQYWCNYRKPKSPQEAQRLYNHIRTVAYYLDAATLLVPFLNQLPEQVSVGIEPIIGAALPVVGDFMGLLFGLYMVGLCMLFGIGWDLIIRMLLNLVLDTFIGIIPVVGDFLDVAFKANLWNLALLEGYLKNSRYFFVTIPPPGQWTQGGANRPKSGVRGL